MWRSRNLLLRARQLVVDAAVLLERERSRCQGEYAVDRRGQPVPIANKRPKPVAWCLSGALHHRPEPPAAENGGRS